MTLPYARSGVVLALLASACGPSSPQDLPACQNLGVQVQSSSAEGRWVLGLASRYPADTTLGAQADTLRHSQRARRAVAWAAVARALTPLPLAHTTGLANATVPRFQTWYDSQDFTRIFQRLYGGLTPAQRASMTRFTDSAMDDAFGWNVDFVNTLPEWTPARLDAYAASLNSQTSVAAISGVLRIAVSPDAVRHVASSYPEVLRCLASGAPPAVASGGTTTQQLAHEPIALPHCGTDTFGPYFVAAGGSLTATVANAVADTRLRVSNGLDPTATALCTATVPTGCTVQGPGVFTVGISAGGASAGGTLDVQYTAPTPTLTACLQGVFPPSAATVALEWRRTDLGMPLPTYDTSAAGITRRLGLGGDATWGAGDDTANPSATEAYTLQLPSGGSFRLAAMHLRTREVNNWLNITLWWSPTPDTDFGADRPAAVRALGGPWSHYKMCVASEFDEQDPDPAGGFGADTPTLAAALRAVSEGQGGPSWCSNPYIDAGPGLVRSNCVGCHQHAMSGVTPAMIQNDPVRFPSNGRTQVRDNFPSDGFWGLDAGDHLAAVISQTVEYYRTAP